MNPLGWQAGDRSWDSGDMSVAGSRGASPLSYTGGGGPAGGGGRGRGGGGGGARGPKGEGTGTAAHSGHD